MPRTGRWHVDAALALDGFNDARGGLVVDGGDSRVGVTVGNELDAGHERFDARAVLLAAGGGEGAEGLAVVATDGRDADDHRKSTSHDHRNPPPLSGECGPDRSTNAGRTPSMLTATKHANSKGPASHGQHREKTWKLTL